MNFAGSESRRSARLVGQSIDATLDLLAAFPNADVTPDGYPGDITDTLESYFVPNVSPAGVVSVPKEYQNTDSIAVIGGRPKQEFALDSTFMMPTPLQLERSVPHMSALSGIDVSTSLRDEYFDVAAHFAYVNQNNLSPIETLGKHLGIVTALFHFEADLYDTDGDKQSYRLRGRPVMVLNIGSSRRGNQPDEPIVAHEAAHVIQDTLTPAYPADSAASVKAGGTLENKAYWVGADVEEIKDQQNPQLNVTHFQRSIRRLLEAHSTPEKPYELTPEGEVAFFNAGYEHSVPLTLSPEDRLALSVARKRA